MKNGKRILVLMLSLMLLFSTTPVTAFALDAENAGGSTEITAADDTDEVEAVSETENNAADQNDQTEEQAEEQAEDEDDNAVSAQDESGEQQDDKDSGTGAADGSVTETGSGESEVDTASMYPEVTLYGSACGVDVVLKAPEGSLPEGVTMSVSAATGEDVVEELLESQGREMTDAVAVDVTLYDKDGNITEPLIPVEVTFSGTSLDVDDNGSVGVYRVSGDTATKVGSGSADEQTFTADHFTIYVAAGSTSDPNGDGSGANSTNNRYELDFGENVVLKSDKSGNRKDEWSVTAGSSYVSFNARTHTVTDNNGSSTSQSVTVRHEYRDWFSSKKTEYFYITVNPQKFAVKFMLKDAGGDSFDLYDTQKVIKGTAAEAPELDEEKMSGGTTYTLFAWYTDETCLTEADLLSITADTTVYAKYTTTRTLTYVENSPEGDKGTIPDPQVCGVGNTVATGTASMPGYSLASWNTEQDGSGTSYNPGDTFVMPDEDVVLYAQWEQGSATVYYYNDGTFLTSETAQPSTNYSVISNIPVWNGHVFRGWATSRNGSPVYYPGQTFVMPEEDVYLYAVWGKADEVTVNGNSLTVTYDGQEHSVSGVQEEVNEDGYYKYDEIETWITKLVLVGYFADCSTITASGTDVGIYSTPVSTSLYYSIIEDLLKYFRYVDFFGTPYYGTVNAGQLIIEPAELTITTESAEKKYDGTPLTAGGTIEGLVNGETVTFTVTGSQTEVGTSDNTYTLYWDGTANRHNYTLSDDSSVGTLTVYYEVAFDANGGTGAPDALKVTESTAKIPSDVPERKGYEFLGWAESASATEAEYQPGDTFTVDDNMTLYAVWKAEEYDIEYALDGGELEEGVTNPETYTIESEDITLNNPVKTGYTFSGWTGTDLDEATEEVTISKGSTGDRSYTATWTPIDYTIEYDLGGGELEEGVTNPETYTIESEDITLNNPTRTGYTFSGWTGTDLDEATEEVTISKGSTGDRSYTATWTPIDYTIEYDLDGGELEDGVTNPETYTIESDDITLSNPVKTGYTFSGWTGTDLEEAAEEVTIAKGSIGDRSYTATWTENEVTIKYEAAEGGTVDPAEETLKVLTGEASGSTASPDSSHDFVNWTDAEGNVVSTETTFVPQKTGEMYEEATYTANFKLKEFSITYDLGGGTYNGSTDDIVEVHEIGEEITIHEAPTRDGYTFVEWRGSSYQPGDSYTVTEDHTFTAIWKAESSDDEDTADDTDNTDSSAQTGDPTDPAGPLGAFGAALAVLLAMVFARRREHK